VIVPGTSSHNKGRPPGRKEPRRVGGTIRVSEQTHATVRALAGETGEPMQDVIAKAVELYRRQRILERTNAAYAALRSDPQRWQEERDERELWDNTVADGIEDE
jgi:succinate dehydrogenase/fumarate reductase flavoprotein subunit